MSNPNPNLNSPATAMDGTGTAVGEKNVHAPDHVDHSLTPTASHGARRRSSAVMGTLSGQRRGTGIVRRASVAPEDVMVATSKESGFRGLMSNKRSLVVALFASLGGLLYGYNQGVFGQVQVMEVFVARYPDELTAKNPARKGMLTSILELGAWIGALMSGPLADKYSRKYSISAWCVVFILGVIIQVAANHHAACIYAGRWFAGMGVGALSTLVPMWNAEIASPGVRGALVALQQLTITLGIMVSYWIGYGTNFIGGTTYNTETHTGQKDAAWRLPLSLQLIPAAVLLVGAPFLPFSPRWLMLKGREDECLSALAFLRALPAEDPRVQLEFRSLQAERIVEQETAKALYGEQDMNWRTSIKEYQKIFTTKTLLHRLLIAAGGQALQQWTGINAIIYYAPSIFRQLGLTGNTIGLLATGVVGIVNFIMTIPAVLFVDNVGRRIPLIWGSANMAISHATIAAIVAVYGDEFDTHKKAGNAAVFMVFWFIFNFAITWGPLIWIVAAEVWPLQYRSRGMSVATSTNWIMNFTVGLVTPVMFANITWKTYIIFMCFCIVGFIWAVFILPELKGLSLEQIDDIFGDNTSTEDTERRARIAKEIGIDKLTQQVMHREDIENPGGFPTEKKVRPSVDT